VSDEQPDTPDEEQPDVSEDESGEPSDDEDLEEGEALITEAGDHLTYDVSGWAGESRTMLDSLLAAGDVPHTWQGTELTVPTGYEEDVDALIDEVLASAAPALEADRAKVVYEVGSWSAAMQSGLAESLGVADVAYEWNESGDLVIYADDEEEVDRILDGMPDPDDEELADADGLAVQDVLSRLFLASGTLRKDPTESDAVIRAVEAVDRLEHMAVPFGFEPPVWRALVDDAMALRTMLDGEDGDAVDDEEIATMAGNLRTRLRQFV
jgi:hypothetical protein